MSTPDNVIWAPQPGSQTVALHCPIGEVLYEGTRGPGKSAWLLADYAKHVGRGWGASWRGIIFRESYPQLADVVAKSKALFYQVFPGARFNEAKYVWTFADGEELLLRQMSRPDDYWNYHGHEYPFIGWEELTNWQDLQCYHAMKACWRSSRVGIPKRFASNANPFGIGHHAVKSYYIDPAPAGVVITDDKGKNPRVRIHGHWSENKALLAADPEYPDRLLADPNSNRRKAWFNGSWDVVAGGFFDDVYDARYHELQPFRIPSSWRVDRSFDWGSSRPFSVGWWAESDGTQVDYPGPNGTTIKRSFPRGSLIRIAEWYGWNGQPNEGVKMPATEIAKGIKEMEARLGLPVRPGPADGSIYDVVPGERSIADAMATQGVTWIAADKSPGSRKNGWDRIRQMLHEAAKKQPEDAGLWTFNTCRQFIRILPMLPRDPLKPEDVDTKAEDHVGDEVRYRCLALRHKMTQSTYTQ